jgi:heme-degrading monooxygenase HmoA
MVARTWRGWTAREDADAYVDYLLETGMKHYEATPGNRGAYIMRRSVDDRTEFVTLSLWDDLESIKGFAGEDIGKAVFYPEDDRFLVERETVVSHFEVILPSAK